MKKVNVTSSNIAAIGYDKKELKLYVDFKNGYEYVYHDVPRSIHKGLMEADSHGKYLSANVKGHFEYNRIK